MLITFEGPDGSGKSSQLQVLRDYLKSTGLSVLCTREPGGSSIGDQIRKVLLDNHNLEMHPRTEILLFQASRAQLVEQIIKPGIKDEKIVLCDRYADSTLAYQGYGHRVDLEQLRGIINFATSGLKPDLTILLDLDVKIGLQRRSKDGDVNRLDRFVIEFHQRVRQGYQHLMKAEPERWVLIDASKPFTVVQKEVRQVVVNVLSDWGIIPLK
jgi:dTMP kinase